jgi:hypothetical protein
MRRLCLLGFNPLLDDFLRVIGSENTLSEMVSMYFGARDHGFTALWMPTCPVSADPRPVDAFEQVLYLVKHCPRLRELLRIMKEGAFKNHKTRDGPRTQFFMACYWTEKVFDEKSETNERKVGYRKNLSYSSFILFFRLSLITFRLLLYIPGYYLLSSLFLFYLTLYHISKIF